jgi:cell wall-associated NlpC family hydrolase
LQRSYGFPGWCAICRWTAVGAISVGTMAVLGAATSDHRPAPTVVQLAAQPEGTGLDWPGWTVRDPAEQRRSLDLLLSREKDRRAAATKSAATSIVSRTAAPASPSTVAVPQSALGHGTTLAAPQAVSVAIKYALAQVGKPYVWGATGPDSYDCSGLVQRSYAMAGVALPRTSRQQARVGKAVDLPDLLPGDLLFWAYNPADRATVHHVALYLGDGKIVQAPQPGEFVEVTTMWLSGYAGAVRVATGPATAALPPVPVGVPGTGITPVGDAMPDGSPPPSPAPPADSPPRIQHRSGASSQSGSSPGPAGTTTPDGTPGTSAPGTTTPGTTTPGTSTPGTSSPGSTSPGTTSPGSTAPGTTSPGTTSPGSSASGDSSSPTGSHEPTGSASGTGAPATSSAAPDPTTPPAGPTSSAPSSTPPPPPPTTPAPPSTTPPPPAPSPSGDAAGDSAAPATTTSAPPEPSVSPSSPTPSPT